jgi:hypothetical protein
VQDAILLKTKNAPAAKRSVLSQQPFIHDPNKSFTIAAINLPSAFPANF